MKVNFQMCKSVFIAMPKKPGAVKCELHRAISLMSHMSKILLRVLINRVKGRTKCVIGEVQYGYVEDEGTRNAIYLLRMMMERSIQVQKNLYVCFIGYVKAFDRHEKLMEVLEELDIDEGELKHQKSLLGANCGCKS
ncbi:uncharacterized protein [Penaeus vannamei]|uniref:uncharacterized protein n=1 Tax=Penaeus vannamei TaxID=6689 RepID=UPI00387F4F15